MAETLDRTGRKRDETWLGRFWRSIKLIYLFLLPTRFSLLSIVLVGWAFLISDQGVDILRALVEFDPCKSNHPHVWRMFAFVIATSAFSTQAWYWTRQILRLEPPPRVNEDDYFAYPPPPERFPRTMLWIPRVLGVLGFIIPIFAFLRIGLSYSDKTPGDVKVSVSWMLFWLVLALAAFLIFVVLRRKLLGGPPSTLRQHAPQAFPGSTKAVLAVTVIAELSFFIWATLNPVSFAPLGSGSLVLLTAALWIPIGTMLVLLGIRLRFPILSAFLVWSLLWSPIADWNHVIRTMGPAPRRLDAVQQLEAWYQRVTQKTPQDPMHGGERVPIFVVATEGGGIRAAYWTAAVLTAVQDRYPEFADHLFAISGVSGGSLGAAVFDAVYAHRLTHGLDRPPGDPYERVCPGKDPVQLDDERKTLRYAAKKVLSFDALTPTLAGMTQPDLAQRFLPFGFPDREKALEEAWERGWSRTMGGDDHLFSQGIISTLQANPRLPSLFLNGTMVETGDRIITSNCRIHPRKVNKTCAETGHGNDDNPLCEFRNAFDSFTDLYKDVPFSAAAGMSARFTYVSPAGRLPKSGSEDALAGHVVDGGYFENSGAVTAAEIVSLIQRVAAARGWNLQPYVILIDSEDASERCKKNGLCEPDRVPKPFAAVPDADGPTPQPPERWVNEVLSPLRALLKTRGARGSQAVGDIRELLAARLNQHYELIEFRLVERKIPLPLGWLLSERSRIAIDNATELEGGNVWARERIGDLLHVQRSYVDPVAASAAASTTEMNKENL
jgi:hypothetical protein